jgi:type VI secretion system protein ImpH
MARARRIPNASLITRLTTEPWRFRFFQAVRILERQRARYLRSPRSGEIAAVGEEAEPHQRTVRFRAATQLSFPASEIDEVGEEAAGLLSITTTFLGLSGPSSVLPQHYSVALRRELRNRNAGLKDFFDLFSDRFTAFFYRAWAKYRVPVAVERSVAKGQDGASEALRGLIGFGTDHLADRTEIAEHSLLHYSGLLGHFPRNAASLRGLLCDYFRLPVGVEPFDGRWLTLPASERTRLGGAFAGLSTDAVVGESYWDVESSFLIEIGPIDYAVFVSFMPNGGNLRRLASLTRLYVNPEMGFRVELCLQRNAVPPLRLDPEDPIGPLLGWNTWLSHYPMPHDPRDATYRL